MNWIKIYISTDIIKIEIIKQMLQENDIPSVIINKKDSSYNMFGNIELFTQKKFYKNALTLIDKKGNE